MKRVVLLSASPRKNGNSDILCHQFIKGAENAGHTCELISLYEKKIDFCKACYACFKTGKCVLKYRLWASDGSEAYFVRTECK